MGRGEPGHPEKEGKVKATPSLRVERCQQALVDKTLLRLPNHSRLIVTNYEM